MISIKDFDQIELSPEFQAYDPQDQSKIKTEWIKKNIASTPEFKSYSDEEQSKLLNTLINRKPAKMVDGSDQVRLARYQPTSFPGASEDDFVPGVQRGLQNLQASWYGAGALAGKGLQALGAEETGKKLWNVGVEGYKRNIKEAEQYPKRTSFKDVYTGKAGVGGAIDWLQGTAGELVPSMAEAAIGAVAGSLVAPGPGTAVGGLAGRTLLKKGIDQAVKKAVKEGVEGLTESQIRKQVTKQALKKLGGKAGIGAAVMPMESGGMYGELLESHGVDAPETAMLFGALATSLEFFGGNSKLVDTFVDALAKGTGGIAKKSAKEILTNIPQEALQEGGQELFNILNTVANTDEELITAENVEQVIESMAAGAVGGSIGAATQTVMGSKESKQEKRDRLIEKQATNIISGGRDNIIAATTKLNEDINKINKLLNDPDALSKRADELDTTVEKLTISLSDQVSAATRLQERLGKEDTTKPKTEDDVYWDKQEKEIKDQKVRQQKLEELQKSPDYQRRVKMQEEINSLWEMYNQEKVPTAEELPDLATLAREKNQQKLDNIYMPAEQELDEIHNKKIRELQALAETPEEKSSVDEIIENFRQRMRNRKAGISESNVPIIETADPTEDMLIDPSVEEPYDIFARTTELLGGKVEPTIIYDKDAYRREVEAELEKVNTEPSEAQKEAGNYKKGHIKIAGFDVTIENPAGSTRSGKDQDGNEWSSEMAGHYGYFKRTAGKDGDQVDVFIKDGATESPSIYVVDQIDPKTGKFDEHKVVMGTNSTEEAKDLYMANYEDGWNGFGAIKEMTPDEFKEWLQDGKRTKKPVALSGKTETSTFTDEQQVVSDPQVLGPQIASTLSEQDPTNPLKFDNVADPGEGFPVRYQFSITDGPARTATFSVSELTPESVKAGLDEMIALRQQKPELEVRENQTPGQGLELDEIRKLYPGQDVFMDDGGKISVRLKNGKGITIENIRDAGKEFVEFAIQTGQMSKDGKILGITVGNKILLDSEFADNMTLWHENKHVIDNLGIVTEADNSALNKEFNKLRKAGKLNFQLSTHEDSKQAMIENRANTFAQVMTSREEYRSNSVLNKMIQKVMDFFNKLYVLGKRAVGNTGFQNTRSLAREVESGKIYERTIDGKQVQTMAQLETGAKRWYSAAKRGIENIAQKVAPAAQWKAMINKIPGIKQDELEWSGVIDWLDDQDGKISKDEVLDFLEQNNLQVEEVIKGRREYISEEDLPADAKRIFDYYVKDDFAAQNDFLTEMAEAGYGVDFGTNGEIDTIYSLSGSEETITGENIDQYPDLLEIIESTPDATAGYVEDIPTFMERLNAAGYDAEIDINGEIQSITKIGTQPTMFAQYQLPGGENYREVFITTPKADSIVNFTWTDGHAAYEDIINPIVRIRINDRTGPNGEKLLVIEELQGPQESQVKNMPKLLQDPTKQRLYGIKRMVRWAAENGYDGIAWTPGQVQADRYDLSKQIDELTYRKNPDGEYQLFAFKDGDVILEQVVPENKLESVIGKDIAQRIIDGEGKRKYPDSNRRMDMSLSGLDLKIGGEGLKKIYDVLIPNEIKKFFGKKAWGKPEVGTIEVKTGNDYYFGSELIKNGETVDLWHLQITPEMKSKALREGMPLFETREPLPEQKISDEQYLQMHEQKKNILKKTLQSLRMKASDVKLMADKSLTPISTRLKIIGLEDLSNKLRQLDFKTAMKITDALREAHPMMKKAKKEMSPADRTAWDWARKNSDIGKITQLARKYGIEDNYNALRETLNKIRQDAEDVGLKVGYIEDYWPRVLKDQEGFLQAAYNDPDMQRRAIFTEAIKNKANELGITVNELNQKYPELKADIISNIILGRPTGIGGPSNTMARVFEEIPDIYAEYYMDSDAALMQYIYSMTKKIEARKFFGKIPQTIATIKRKRNTAQTELLKLEKLEALATSESATEDDQKLIGVQQERIKLLKSNIKDYNAELEKYKQQRDYTENIGAYINDLMIAGKLNKKDEQAVKDILDTRFHERGTTKIPHLYKNIAYIDVMGNPMAAITQVGDLAWAAYVGEIWNPLRLSSNIKNLTKAIFKKSNITKEDLGIERMAQEFADFDSLSNIVSKVFRGVGLERIDSVGKDFLINNAFDSYQRQASTKDGRTKLLKKLRPIFGDESNKVINDLLANNPSENVKMLLYSRLLDFQPVALSEMPEYYLKGGNWRILYMLKTYTIKQLDVFRNEVWRGLKDGDSRQRLEAIRNMAQLMSVLVLANAAADEIKDLMLGKEIKFSDNVIENFLTMGGANRFVRMQSRREGIGTAIGQMVLPPFKFVNALSKDVLSGEILNVDESRTLESLPFIGKLAYWNVGRGSEYRPKIEEQDFRKAGKKFREFKTSFEEANDKRLFLQSNLDDFKQMKVYENFNSSVRKITTLINKLKKLDQTTSVRKRIGQLEERQNQLMKRYFMVAENQ